MDNFKSFITEDKHESYRVVVISNESLADNELIKIRDKFKIIKNLFIKKYCAMLLMLAA